VRVLTIAGADPAYAVLTGNVVPVLVRERGVAAMTPVPALRAPVVALLALGIVLLATRLLGRRGARVERLWR